jgi:hypothetical protein
MLLGVLGLLVIAFATTRMAYLERQMRRARTPERSAPVAVRSTA